MQTPSALLSCFRARAGPNGRRGGMRASSWKARGSGSTMDSVSAEVREELLDFLFLLDHGQHMV